jgi:hypothetical protein
LQGRCRLSLNIPSLSKQSPTKCLGFSQKKHFFLLTQTGRLGGIHSLDPRPDIGVSSACSGRVVVAFEGVEIIPPPTVGSSASDGSCYTRHTLVVGLTRGVGIGTLGGTWPPVHTRATGTSRATTTSTTTVVTTNTSSRGVCISRGLVPFTLVV